MKVYALLLPDYEGDVIIGIFSSEDKAREQLNAAYWDTESYEIKEFDVDPTLGTKYQPYYSHEIPLGKDHIMQEVRNDWDSSVTPSEYVWNNDYSGFTARGLGASPEEAEKRVNLLLVEYSEIPVTTDCLAQVVIPRPELKKKLN